MRNCFHYCYLFVIVCDKLFLCNFHKIFRTDALEAPYHHREIEELSNNDCNKRTLFTYKIYSLIPIILLILITSFRFLDIYLASFILLYYSDYVESKINMLYIF